MSSEPNESFDPVERPNGDSPFQSPCGPDIFAQAWKRPSIGPVSATVRDAWEQAFRLSCVRERDEDPLIMVTGTLPPPPLLPDSLAQVDTVVLDALVALSEGLCGLANAAIALGKGRRNLRSRVVIVSASSLLSIDLGNDSCVIALDVLGRLQGMSRRLILTGTPADAERLRRKGLPVRVVRIGPVPIPRFLQPIPAARCVGREAECDEVASLLLSRQHVLVTGPAGCGKTTLCLAVAGHPLLAGREAFLLSPIDLVSGTEFRGSFENRVAELLSFCAEQDEPPILVVDEILQGLQRTGSDRTEGNAGPTDSFLDYLKADLAASVPRVVLLGTCTDRELARLRRFDPAISRRFAAFVLKPPVATNLAQVVDSWADALDLELDARQRARVIRMAPFLLPAEVPPAREIKVLGWWKASGCASIDQAVRRQLGELAAPRRTQIQRQIERVGRVVFGREAELRAVADATDRALEHLLCAQGDLRGPFLAVLLAGPSGTGKRFLARQLAAAFGPSERVHEVGADQDELVAFAQHHRDSPCGLLIVSGAQQAPLSGMESPAAGTNGPPGDGLTLARILHSLGPLNRWLVFLCVDVPAGPGVTLAPALLDAGTPVLILTTTPTPIEPAHRPRIVQALARDLRRRAAVMGMSRATPPPTFRDLQELCATAASPREIERRIVAAVLGLPSPGYRNGDPSLTPLQNARLPGAFSQIESCSTGSPDESN